MTDRTTDLTATLTKGSDGSEIDPATEEKQDNIITGVNALQLQITNALDFTAFDLNAGAFSETTSITNDYELDNVEFNFTTTESKTITITSSDGTVLLRSSSNTDTSFVFQPSSELAFNGGENLTVAVTQTSGACSMDCILKIKQGTSSLLGDPVLDPSSKTQIVDENGNVIGSSNLSLKTCPEEHHTAFNEEYTATAGGDIAATTIITPSAGKKISIHVLAIVHTDGSSGTISLDFLSSGVKALRMYPSRAATVTTSQDHTEGAADEVLTLTADSIGNGSKVFVKIQYIEE